MNVKIYIDDVHSKIQSKYKELLRKELIKLLHYCSITLFLMTTFTTDTNFTTTE